MRRLPVLAAFQHVWATVFSNAGAAFRLSWPWLLVVGLMGLFLVAISPTQSETPAISTSESQNIAAFFLAIFVFMLAFASIAVNWHRYVLLDEMPKGSKFLRIDGLVWRYLGNLLLILLIVAVPFGIAVGIYSGSMDVSDLLDSNGGLSPTSLPLLAIAFFLTIMVAVNIIIYRLSIKLPAVALGRRDYGVTKAWDDSKGNALPILGFAFLVYLSLTIPERILDWASESLASPLGILGAIQLVVVGVVFQWFALIVGISALTSLYGFFAEKRDF
jgi:hypothetical protein